jgi:fatty-acyl-CoA synthase
METLPALLDAVAMRAPDSEAFIGPGRRTTFARLRDDSIAIARGLATRGVGHGTRIGLLMPNRAEWLATAFAVWRCGAVLVPLSTLARPRELAHCLRSARVMTLIAVRRFLRHDYEAMLAEIGAGLPALREVVWLGDDPADAANALAAPGAITMQVSPADPATVTFTSGTTSDPKGAVHVHRALCRAAIDIGATLGIEPTDRTWGYLPFFFNAGWSRWDSRRSRAAPRSSRWKCSSRARRSS